MRREVENWEKSCAAGCTKLMSDFAINAPVKNLCGRRKKLMQRVVMVSSQPDCRNSGKNARNFCFKMKHEKRNRMRK
jgi:hypothetical protein